LTAYGDGVPARAEHPNVVFILVDDLGWADVGCFNDRTTYETPSVDRLADQGMTFTDFYSAGPVCSPTRASIMTGKYPARLRITRHLLTPKLDPPHMANHLGLEEWTIAEAFQENGYATGYFGKWHLGYKSEHWASHQGFGAAAGGIDIPWAWELCYPDRTPPTKETWRKGHTRFFSPYHLTHLENGPEGEYLTERLTDETIRFIEQNRGRPFFVLLSFHTVHTPLEARPHVVDKYREKIEAMGLDKKRERSRNEKQYQNNPDYAAMVHHMEKNVGRLLGRLDELELADLPLEPDHHVDGVSFKPILLGESDHVDREALYWHYPHSRNEGAVRLGDHKLLYRYKTGTAELYNLAEDIGETRDLIADAPVRAQRMTQMLERWHREVGARFAGEAQ